jgi:glycine cleavage system H protein
MHPKELSYTPEHIWVKEEGEEELRLGLTDYYQGVLHTIVYIDLPQVGRALKRGEPFGSVESSKTTSDLVSPLTGTVTRVNPVLAHKPGLINRDPYGDGWLMIIEASKPEEKKNLLSAEGYLKSAPPEDGGPCQA